MIVVRIFSLPPFFPLSIVLYPFNPLPNEKVLDVSKLKAFADDKLFVAKMIVFLFDTVENSAGKAENVDYHHFLHFPHYFPKPSH